MLKVRGEEAAKHLQQVMHKMARMKMALHKIKSGKFADHEAIAMDGLS